MGADRGVETSSIVIVQDRDSSIDENVLYACMYVFMYLLLRVHLFSVTERIVDIASWCN